MRIAVVHNFYRSVLPSGENQVVTHQVEGLQARGHDVLLVSRTSDDIRTARQDLAKIAWDVARHDGVDPTEQLSAFRPDVVHIHNLFPSFGSQWLAAWHGPVVATLHNYRSVCANAVLSRDGQQCTLCPDGARWSAIRYRCYRDSLSATLPMAWRLRRGARGDPVLCRADRIIVLSEYTQAMFRRFGVPGGQMELIPNGVPDPGGATRHRGPTDRYAAVGRLSAEKGFGRLLREWPDDVPLDIIGAGPQYEELRQAAPPRVQFRGLLPHPEFLQRLQHYSALVVPGTNPEGGYPMVTMEALAADVPLVAHQGGVVAPLVERSGCGVVYRGAHDLPTALKTVAAIEPGTVRAVYDAQFTEAGWLDRLEGTYRDVAVG